MNEEYAGATAMGRRGIMAFLETMYIRVFGIPEIGFQVRAMYFCRALDGMGPSFGPSRILDVGSGIGGYVFELARRYPESRIDGWEIDRKKLSFTGRFAAELGVSNVRFSYGDITDKPKKTRQYDFVYSVDVLEHITDYRSALRHMYALLKPGGRLYLHTPAEHQKRFFRKFDTWEHEDHVREGFDPGTLTRDLKKCGFRSVHATHSFGFFGSLAWELNHMSLSRGFVLAAFLYPFLYLMARLDAITENRSGLCIAVTARK